MIHPRAFPAGDQPAHAPSARARSGRSSAGPGRLLALAVVAPLLLPAAGGAQTEPKGSVEDRLGRVERMLDTGTLIQLLESVKALQGEVRTLRGEIELQGHKLNQLEERQRELYLDVDRRLQRMESAGVPAAAGMAPSPGAPAAPQPGSPTAAGATAGVAAGAAASSGTGTPSSPAATASPPSPPAAQPGGSGGIEEQQDYQAAFNLLKAGRYDQAAKAFRSFLDAYPDGKYADNAQYWLGETYYVTRKFEAAMTEFQKLVKQHPDSQKLTHAMLKIGYIYDEMGEKDQAKQTLTALIQKYPQSTAAGLAQKRLERLGTQ